MNPINSAPSSRKRSQPRKAGQKAPTRSTFDFCLAFPMFHYLQNTLYCEDVALADVAKKTGTPAYVYSSAVILDNYRAYDDSFGELPHTVCYAVKANSSLGILSI